MNRNTHSGSEGSSPRQLSLAHSFSSSVTRIEDEDDHENEPSLVDFWSRPPNCSASPPFEGHA